MLKIQAAAILFLILTLATVTSSQTTAFNYQGKLTDGGSAATGTYQIQFALFDAATGGNQIGTTIENTSVVVSQGIFNVKLDFGAAVFTGADRFLQMGVRRNAGESYTILSPREQIASSPYAIRTLSAAQADLSLDSQKLGGLDASEYVTNSTVGNSFIRNDTTQQTGNFNISGNGFFNGNVGIGTTTPSTRLQVFGSGYGLTQTNGTVTVGTFLGPGSGWFGTRSNHPLNFFTNDAGAAMQISTTGEVGIGVAPQAGTKLDVGGAGRFQFLNGNINLGTPNSEIGMTIVGTNRADVRFNGSILTLAAGTGTGVPANTGISVNTSGNVGIGTTTPGAKLEVEGGGLTGSTLRVINNGLGTAIFASSSLFGNALSANGNISVTGNVKQNLTSNGVVKAMAVIEYGGSQIPTITRCYDGINGSTASDCGFIYGPVNLGLGAAGTRINFGFTVNNRYILTTPFGNNASFWAFPNDTTVDINDNRGGFFIFVY